MPVNINLEFRLSEKQRLFVESKKPWTAFIGGVGSGKTHSGAVKSLIACIEEPGSLGVVAAPTFTMLKDNTQRMLFEQLPREIVASFNKNEQKLTLINGTEVLFRSMDEPDKIRGLNIAWFWLDEAPLAGYYAFLMLKQRAGRQDKTRFRKRGWITGTPKGKDGYYTEFVKKPTEEHFLVRASTRDNLKHLPDNYIEGMGLSGAFFQQEVEGSFEAFEGLVYLINEDKDDEDVPLRHSHIQEAPRGKRYKLVVGGIDWGYTNPAVALVIGVDGDGRAWLIDEFYKRQQQLESDFIPAVMEFTREYGVERWWCDPAEPEHIQKLKNAFDSSMYPGDIFAADNTITAGIQTVQRFLQIRPDGMPGLLVSRNCPNTIKEFGVYQYDKQPEMMPDELINEKPKKQADHSMDALRYVLHNEFGDVLPGTPFKSVHTPDSDDPRYLIDYHAQRAEQDDDFLFQRRTQAARSMRWVIDRTGGR